MMRTGAEPRWVVSMRTGAPELEGSQAPRQAVLLRPRGCRTGRTVRCAGGTVHAGGPEVEESANRNSPEPEHPEHSDQESTMRYIELGNTGLDIWPNRGPPGVAPQA
jgi:hypothetical protein